MKRSSANRRFRPFSLAAVIAAVSLIAACSNGDADKDGKASGDLDKARVILDWTPNTNHTGIYVAQEKGYYVDEGLDVEVLGFSKQGVETVVANGGAEFGFSGTDSLAAAHASGLGLKMVFNLQPKSSYAVGVLASSDIERPRDLDGKTIADYGAGSAHIATEMMIKHDGGTGQFDRVVVGVQAMQALEAGEADFAEVLTTWESIEAELDGFPLRTFSHADYGVPTTPALLGISTTDKLTESDPDLVERFVRATQKGYQFAIDNPEEAAQILLDANPQAKLSEELVMRSQKLLSTEYWPDEEDSVGHANLENWQTYLDFIVESGLVYNSKGEAVSDPIKAADLVTNDFLK